MFAVAAVGVFAATTVAACGPQSSVPTLTWYINPDAGGQTLIAEQCTEEANGAYQIQTSILPRDAAGQREQLVRRLASKDSSIDLMSIDPVYVAELAQAEYIVPVPDDLTGPLTENTIESSVESSSWEGKLVATPFWANTQLLWYRKSVAEAAGLDMSKPVTWDQLIDAAKSQEKEIGAQGIRAEAYMVWLNALIESAGGQIVENPEASAREIQLGLDSEAGKKAAEIVSTIGKEGLGGPTLSTQDENGALTRFQGDTGGFMVNWPFVYAAAKASVDAGALDQSVLDDIAWTTYPAVDEGTPAAPPLGGINIGVGAFGKHQDEAWQAVQCIVEPQRQSQYFVSDGNPPSNTASFDDPKVAEGYPMYETIRKSLEMSAPRPLTPYYNEVTGGLQRTWHPAAGVSPDSTPGASTTLMEQILKGERLL
ncbi:extracellular solute-binding protein [Saxibacter everestensis]|uniref:Extracellular solute-binding protein n=1 Tax=Saxibacter everestensis TaxID=2909229 RepID=A0ABY8QPL5_9MICO|nr:extracellular solute-binding protein [Brevibacteriaceae bacterium ZFBP1038]